MDNYLGKNIKHFRQKMGYTQEELGCLVGYGKGGARHAINRLETQLLPLGLPTNKVQAFADAFGITPFEVCYFEEIDFTTPMSNRVLITKYEARVK